ncbi:unnamed protein product [Didymodactylos carnosus]|uniref:Tc1-like transposase DDE domain-containing protein n=1 Tax=Didymodactylos carnosus TaxID=1234261 RepID=A0A815DMI2_9BILA|nr:unnamed protein product [Didymodactylos carnosus]CAF4120389.1 unnamed protein product [Didymodactylos carnosus]
MKSLDNDRSITGRTELQQDNDKEEENAEQTPNENDQNPTSSRANLDETTAVSIGEERKNQQISTIERKIEEKTERLTAMAEDLEEEGRRILGYDNSSKAKVKLDKIHKILSKQLAFQNVTKLEIPASKYTVKIIYCPKYHCESNAIEGLWCNQKAFVRSRTDQSFEKLIKLIADSRIHFVERNIALKLFRRFWRSIEAYSQGQTYADVLKLFFSQLCKTSVQSHRRISNKNINEP